MLSWLGPVFSVIAWPVRMAWKGYSGLWWAFEDDAPRADPKVADGVGSPLPNKPRERPTRALKQGFVATLVMSLSGAWSMVFAHEQGLLSEPRAILGVAWLAALATVTSLLAVRRGVRRQAKARAELEAEKAARAAMPLPQRAASGAKGALHKVRSLAASARSRAQAGLNQLALASKLRRIVQ